MNSPTNTRNGNARAIDYSPVVPPEASRVQVSVKQIKDEIGKIQKYQDDLEKRQSTEGNVAKALEKFRKDIKQEDEENEKAIEAIKALLEDPEGLRASVTEELKEEIEREMNDIIEAKLAEEVTKSLEQHTSMELQNKLDHIMEQIVLAQRELHNAESRRANCLLRLDQPRAALTPLFKPNEDQACPSFPKSLSALFALDDAAIQNLCVEYGLPVATAPHARDTNMNEFLRYIGVQYQMEPVPGGPSLPVLLRRYG